jgi:citrate lyase subunit beta/citryl-CoA lyase
MTHWYRSKLFVPGNRPELFEKALASGADAISIDLEDAVPAGERPAARQLIGDFLDSRPSAAPAAPGTEAAIAVRLNSRESGVMIEDLLAVVRPGLQTVNVPKVEDPIDILLCADILDHLERQHEFDRPVSILATIESPAGVRRVAEIAGAHRRLAGLQFGVGDFAIAMGMTASPARLMPAWSALVAAAREAGIAAYDSAYTDIVDLSGFAAWAAEARACGFAGKSCIHPSQVDACNKAFSPTRAEIEQARAIVDAYDQAVASGRGALTFNGRLIDYPFAEEARRVAGLAPADRDEAVRDDNGR